ncbi:hypothetical protein O0235_01740 [Tepidiforma flava]|uniref:Uncharacterized protein n=1 Tax=Tepidiforma flava TaxID=3004094 RepID=A0ABY7M8I1_9CHLR|nr:hypothetical protein [Tepidiforma flava]WBL36328.1 hypothetical protein O0235_01740 [Tepidiforma flava]
MARWRRGAKVIAGAEAALQAGEAGEQFELAAGADDAELFETAADLACGGAALEGEGDR